tara:strand:+ start:56 stop:649 length:594 start_codon:yes stop_codon:yes gene_type:complete
MAFDVPDPNTPPESEPLSFYAGTTVKWKRTDLADFPAPTWTLNYFLQKDGTKIDFTSSQDGSTANHSVSLAHATTSSYTVGIYHWIVEARSSSEVYVVDSGVMEIKTDFAEQTSGYDDRSVAKKMVDAYEALFANQITNKTIEQMSYSIAGRSISKLTAGQIREEYYRWKQIYQSELDNERINNGLGTRKRILTRFC